MTENGRRFVTIDVDLAGLKPGPHGLNIHEAGGVSCDDGTCTGDSFNPLRMPHGAPDSLQKFGASAAHYVGEGVVYFRHGEAPSAPLESPPTFSSRISLRLPPSALGLRLPHPPLQPLAYSLPPLTPARPVGDLGNVVAGPDGTVKASISDSLIQLDASGKEGEAKQVLGRSVVVRAGEDKFLLNKDDGDAGPILAYGTIAAAAAE